MRRRGVLFAVMLATVPLTISLAAAASLSFSTSGITAGVVVVAPCDADGIAVDSFKVIYDTTHDRYEISQVKLRGIDASCDGSTLTLTLTNGAGTDLGSGSVVVADTTATVTLNAPGVSTDVTATRIVVAGP